MGATNDIRKTSINIVGLDCSECKQKFTQQDKNEGNFDIWWVLKNSLPHSCSGLSVGQWWASFYVQGAGAWKFDGYAQWSGEMELEKGVEYDWYMHAFSSGQKDKLPFKGLDDGVKVILKQDGADWELSFVGRIEITETIGNPDAIGGGVEIDDVEEILPDLEDEKQTDGLDNLEQNMAPEGEKPQEKQDEVQDELQEEPQQQKQEEKQEELEQEDEKSKEKQRQKQKQKEEQKEDEQQDEPEYSGKNEK